jgi:hypothetical protein
LPEVEAEAEGSPIKTLRAGVGAEAYFKAVFLLRRLQVTQLQSAAAVQAELLLVLRLTVTTLFLET